MARPAVAEGTHDPTELSEGLRALLHAVRPRAPAAALRVHSHPRSAALESTHPVARCSPRQPRTTHAPASHLTNGSA